MKFALALLLTLSAGHFASSAENWPQWRGPTGNGVAAPGTYPTKFSADENIAWKIELPGRGSSTPAVWENQIFVTSPIDDQDGVLCYNFQGNELWRVQLGAQRPGKHRNATGCNPSPITDGEHLVVYYKSGNVACLNLSGKIQWQLNLQELYGEDTLWWDLGTSPVLAAGFAIVAVMQEGDSFLVAIDLENGKVAWKQERMFTCPVESDQSYTTPNVLKQNGQEVLVTWGADHLTGHAASTGKLLWTCAGFNPENQRAWRVIASSVADNEIAIVPYGRGNFIAGVNLRQASGDITSTHRLWEIAELGADVPTPLLHKNKVIFLTDKGKVHCLDKSTGEELWKGKLPRAKAKYYASPTLAENVLYCAREDGLIMTSIIDNGLTDTQENDIGESVIATPVAVRSKLLIRGEKHLFLIDAQ